MSNKRKRRVRALAEKLNISYQAADNLRKAGRRNNSAVVASADGKDARGAQHTEELAADQIDSVQEREIGEAGSAQEYRVERDDIVHFAYPFVVAQVAGWMELVPTMALQFFLMAVGDGATTKEIELELTREFGRKRPMTLRRSLLPRSGAESVATRAATARLVGHEPPKTFGDLLLLLVRLGVVTEHAGRYTVSFPPPAPEETLPLTPEQRSKVLWFRNELKPGTGGMEMLNEAVRAEGPDFVPPAWMNAVLDTDRHYVPEDRTPAYRPPGTHILLEGVEADPALCDQISRLFSNYLAENPRECPCSVSITKVSRTASTNAELLLIEASCARGHFGYMGKRIEDVCSLDSSREASVELFLQGRPDGESIQARDFFTAYVLWSLAQRSRPASNVMFSSRVMKSGLYRRTERRPGGRTYHRLPSTTSAQVDS